MAISENSLPVRVLATRPQTQNLGWCARLQEAGLAALALSVLEIEPVQEPEQRQLVKNLIMNFDQFNKVIFVSQNAVQHALAWLDDYWPQLPVGIDYFAVGQSTAQLLQKLGITARSCHQSMDSEELLAMPELARVAGEKILICRGRGGRPRLGLELQQRGARVCYAELYERRLPVRAAAALRETDFLSGSYSEVLSAFSGESLRNLVEVLQQGGFEPWPALPVLLPGVRVACQARELGFREMIVAPNATDNAMLQALQGWLPRHRSQADANA